MRRLPIRVRLTLSFAALIALVLTGATWFVYVGFRGQRDSTIDDALRGRALAIIAAGRSGAPADSLGDLLGSSDDQFGEVLASDGTISTRSRNLAAAVLPRPMVGRFRSAFVSIRAERRHVRVYAARRGSGTLLLGTALDDRDDALHRLARLLAAGAAATFGAAVALAWVLARSALQPVERMRREVHAYSARDLDARLRVATSNDELSRLATTLNEMLDRVQGSFEQQRAFVDHASHELRTPLANLTTELELALRGHRGHDELRTALESAAHEVERLNRLASDLLVLARESGGVLPLAVRPVDLGTLVRDTVRGFAARAGTHHIELRDALDDIGEVPVDPDRVRQAVSNLIDNALRATPSGGSVRVALHADDDRATITVSDTGPGFPPHLLQRLLDPAARTPRTTGDATVPGLGLAIVASVAAAHGGRVVATNSERGGEIGFEVPLRRGRAIRAID